MKHAEWLRKTYREDPNIAATEELLRTLSLNTVCREAGCPNYSECFANRTATFMILGAACTRDCRFCGVASAPPAPPDPGEPERVAEAVARLNLRYAVVTSVTRDDLPGGGASHFAETARAIRRRSPETRIELLIPDFLGDEAALETVTDANPDVISHNMETIRPLYAAVRPEADYDRSLRVIENIKRKNPAIRSKSGVMLGLGESREAVLALFDDLRAVGCERLTVGQYLAPSPAHLPVRAYIRPEAFEAYAEAARARGFDFVAAAPFVRSSYRAGEAFFED